MLLVYQLCLFFVAPYIVRLWRVPAVVPAAELLARAREVPVRPLPRWD